MTAVRQVRITALTEVRVVYFCSLAYLGPGVYLGRVPRSKDSMIPHS